MTIVKLNIVPDIEAAISEALGAASLSGLGADGTSEYEVADIDVHLNGDGTYEAVIDCQRVEGKFVSRDDLAEELIGELTNLDVNVEASA